MNTITQLESLGYTFTLEGGYGNREDKIRYHRNGVVTDEELARSLLAELKQNKSEAIRFLVGRSLRQAATKPEPDQVPSYDLNTQKPAQQPPKFDLHDANLGFTLKEFPLSNIINIAMQSNDYDKLTLSAD